MSLYRYGGMPTGEQLRLQRWARLLFPMTAARLTVRAYRLPRAKPLSRAGQCATMPRSVPKGKQADVHREP